MDDEGEYAKVDEITLFKAIDDDGDLLIGYEMSEGMTFIEAVGLLEAIKLSMNERFRSGEWEG